MAQTKGILYLLLTPGDNVIPGDCFSWFDSKCPKKLVGILGAARYAAIDDKKPEYLAVYELKHLEHFDLSQVIKAASPPANLELVDFRVYSQFSEKISPNYASAPDDRIFRTLALQPAPDLSADDYNEWYEQDHVPLLSLSPGWLKSTRWTLKEDVLFRYGSVQKDRKLCNYLAIHEYESMASFETPEFKRAITSPWRAKVMPKIENIVDERRNFKPLKII
ncbi:hypothetical protein BGW36DRAFT_356404 [Talaromyces proteolyticus]|uniref:EthD domain-containing protein n=1 Tax=Talaromyces proteolyticus TaxID=1131652 RepID=A0AAD4PZ59_9EURO|nr:uncharacterized protein BGW36DRAFT_356404 [Talaromyces proteolyticus]KAH8702275.1 hypothetical protein BGW36DRAFT_356404 [Talaromyces proteolyticus]